MTDMKDKADKLQQQCVGNARGSATQEGLNRGLVGTTGSRVSYNTIYDRRGVLYFMMLVVLR